MPEKEQRHRQEPTLRYPEDLVHRFGAKAGILKYVAEMLPGIPQAKMIVSEIGESTESVLRRAEVAKIGRPRLFRSSAKAELRGYEGSFRTLDSSELLVPEDFLIDSVRRSTKRFIAKDPALPEEINVIIAEKSSSSLVGTSIRLPNQDDAYLMSAADRGERDLSRRREDYLYDPDDGIRTLTDYSDGQVLKHSSEINSGLLEVISWHDRIAQLPLMDKTWSYQIEFGLDPLCLFQVRPFLPLEKAGFTLPPKIEQQSPLQSVVIGTTPPEGIRLRVVGRSHMNSSIHKEYGPEDDLLFTGDFKDIYDADEFPRPNLRAFFLSRPKGLLVHENISFMRNADVTVLFPGLKRPQLEAGKVYVLKSDGVNFEIEKAAA